MSTSTPQIPTRTRDGRVVHSCCGCSCDDCHPYHGAGGGNHSPACVATINEEWSVLMAGDHIKDWVFASSPGWAAIELEALNGFLAWNREHSTA